MERVTRISSRGVQLIAGFEGFVGHPYQDSVGVWTIGYGHTEGVGPSTPSMTEGQGRKLLEDDLDHTYAPYVSRLGLPLNQNQFDATVSFVYNLGPGYLSPEHDFGRYLRAHDWHAAADSMLQYDHAGRVELLGLKRRRQAERALFLTPAPTREQQKVQKWEAELAQLRDYVRDHGGHWSHHPIRRARAEALKRALERHGVKNA